MSGKDSGGLMRRGSRALKAVEAATAAALLEEQENALARRAYELRQSGKSWWAISEELEIPEARVQGLIDKAITEASKMVSEHAKRTLLTMEVARLDTLMEKHWARATGDHEVVTNDGDRILQGPSIAEGEFVLKLIQARAKLLGLDNMSATAVTAQTVVVAGTSEEYIAALRLAYTRAPAIEGETA